MNRPLVFGLAGGTDSGKTTEVLSSSIRYYPKDKEAVGR